MCMADTYACPKDSSETECQSPGIKLPCCGKGTVKGAAITNICYPPANVAAYKALDSTFVFTCNNALNAKLSAAFFIFASIYLQWLKILGIHIRPNLNEKKNS